jgi:hypothetical protein
MYKRTVKNIYNGQPRIIYTTEKAPQKNQMTSCAASTRRAHSLCVEKMKTSKEKPPKSNPKKSQPNSFIPTTRSMQKAHTHTTHTVEV